jgi:hypothetical protein
LNIAIFLTAKTAMTNAMSEPIIVKSIDELKVGDASSFPQHPNLRSFARIVLSEHWSGSTPTFSQYSSCSRVDVVIVFV